MRKDYGYILAISDLHIGKRMFNTSSNNINKFERQVNNEINELSEILNDNSCENKMIAIAGDIYDNPDPNTFAINTFSRFKESLKDLDVFACLGNHDISIRNLINNVSPISSTSNFIISSYEPLYEETENQLIIMLSWSFEDEEIKNSMFNSMIREIKKRRKKEIILITHGEIGNPSSTFNIPNALLDLIDICIIGHIHEPGIIKIPKTRTRKETLIVKPGATYYDKKESRGVVGARKIDIKNKEVEIIETKTQVRALELSSNEEIEDALSNTKEDKIYFVKTDKEINYKDLELARKKSIFFTVNKDENYDEFYLKRLEDSNISFTDWVEENYPKYLPIFISIIGNNTGD